MAALTEDTIIDKRQPDLVLTTDSIPCETGETIYIGALVGLTTNYCTPATTALPCIGIANTHAEEGENPNILKNIVVKLPLAGITANAINKIAYAADSGSATLSSNSAPLGPIVDWETGFAWVNLTLSA